MTTTTERKRLEDVQLDGSKVKVVAGMRQLGAQLNFTKSFANPTGANRVAKGVEIAKRIRWAPLPLHAKEQLLASLVVPGALYGSAVTSLQQSLLNNLRTVVTTALWGDGKLRCREAVLTLLVRGHLVDPEQAAAFQSMLMLRRSLCKMPESHGVFYSVWSSYSVGRDRVPGPIGIVCKVVSRLGWKWEEPLQFTRPGRPPLPICEGSEQWWCHEIRDGLRCAEWRIAAARRPDFLGIGDAGIDRRATMALLHNKKLARRDLPRLRRVLCGGTWSRARLHAAGLAESSMCQFCQQSDETVEHLFWHCPAWEHIRLKEPGLPSRGTTDAWPACTRNCGIFPEDDRIMQLQMELHNEEPELRSILASQPHPPVVGATKQICWTDGASRNNQDNRLRRAGCGIFFGQEHPSNFSCKLPGREQSNNRAELLAVILAMLNHGNDLEVRSDSQYVVDGFNVLQQNGALPSKLDNKDLWDFAKFLLNSRNAPLRIVKVLGHAKAEDVRRGRTSQQDKDGNDEADKLAVAGAALHAVEEDVAISAAWRAATAKATQSMMLKVLEARSQMEQHMSNLSVPSDADPG